MIRILFVCLGNICRSPMAEFVFKDMVNQKGMSENFYIDSSAISDYNEINKEGIYEETKNILKEMHIPFTEHMSKQIKKEDYDRFDYILAMEEKNVSDILDIIKSDKDKKVFKLLDFTETSRDIADPWYSGDFYTTFYDITYGCECFLEYLDKNNK